MKQGVTGASSPGVLTELLAVGGMDSYIKAGAKFSLWRFRFTKVSNYAMEPITLTFDGQVAFGGNTQLTLGRNGDLVYYMYMQITVPAIVAITPNQGPNQCGPFQGYAGLNAFPSLSLAPNAQDGCPTQYVSGQEQFNQTYYNGAWNGCRDAYLTNQYSARNTQPHDQPFSDTASVQAELFQNDPNCPCPVPNAWVHWHNAFGQKVIKSCALLSGPNVITTITSDFMYMWEELAGKPGKELTEMIGKRETRRQLIEDAKQDQTFYVPLFFPNTMSSGSAIAYTSMRFSSLRIVVDWERLENLVVTSSPNVTVVKSCNFTPLTNQDLQASMLVTYVLLDQEERQKYANADFDQLIVQYQGYTADYRSSSFSVPLNFNNPVKEIIWAVRRKVNAEQNNSFNFSGIDGRDPIKNVCLKFDNQPRFATLPGPYFRLVQPYQFHSRIPKSHVYCYCFSLDPESPQPLGSINWSRVPKAELDIELQTGLEMEQVTFIIFAVNMNLLRYLKGVAAPLFNN